MRTLTLIVIGALKHSVFRKLHNEPVFVVFFLLEKLGIPSNPKGIYSQPWFRFVITVCPSIQNSQSTNLIFFVCGFGRLSEWSPAPRWWKRDAPNFFSLAFGFMEESEKASCSFFNASINFVKCAVKLISWVSTYPKPIVKLSRRSQGTFRNFFNPVAVSTAL